MGILEGILYMMWRGIAIGVIISAPMGPVGILCIQRTLEKGRATGFFTGVGAAISDLFYCLLTGFCLSFIEDFLKANQNLIQIIGSIVLVAFGIYLFRSNPARSLRKPDVNRVSKRKNILSGFLFTFSNPLIVFLIIGLFARFNFLLPEINLYQYLIGYVFIFAGALLWWWVVTLFVDKVRAHFNLRSMWLINKITGGIILIFAVVGIVTALTAYASAATPAGRIEWRFYNESRGSECVIDNPGPDTMRVNFPVGRGDFRLTARVSNLNNARRKSYSYAGTDGRKHRQSHPSWGIMIDCCHGSDDRDNAVIEFQTSGDNSDDIYTPSIRMKVNSPGEMTEKQDLSGVLDPYTGENAFLLSRSGATLLVKGGSREYRQLAEIEDCADADSIGFFVSPGGRLRIDNVAIESAGEPARGSFSSYGNEDMIESYLRRSRDAMEGIWILFDRSFDESRLRPGGDYRLALIAAPDGGYEIIYLEGAVRNGAAWKSGMLRGKMQESKIPGVYDVEWLGADFRPLPDTGKAQLESPGLLSIHFPYLASTLRLKKIR